VPGWNQSCLIFIDSNTGKILETKRIEDRGQWLTHFSASSDGRVLTTSIPTPRTRKTSHGEIYLGTLGTELSRLKFPSDIESQLKNEFLSIAFDRNKKMAVVTNPRGKNVLFIDMNTQEIVRHVKLHANGVGLLPNGADFIFSPFASDELFLLGEKGGPHVIRPILKDVEPSQESFIFDSGHLLVI
jgi:hypothetical protein